MPRVRLYGRQPITVMRHPRGRRKEYGEDSRAHTNTDLELNLALLIEGVDCGEAATQARHGVEQHRVVDAVGRVERQRVPSLEPARSQIHRNGLDLSVRQWGNGARYELRARQSLRRCRGSPRASALCEKA